MCSFHCAKLILDISLLYDISSLSGCIDNAELESLDLIYAAVIDHCGFSFLFCHIAEKKKGNIIGRKFEKLTGENLSNSVIIMIQNK